MLLQLVIQVFPYKPRQTPAISMFLRFTRKVSLERPIVYSLLSLKR